MEMPLVTIACPTYNHEKFIKQTIESFLMQKTTFRYEILIHDDASTDNTPNIIKEYATLYPELIKPVFQTVNQHSKGVKNAQIIFPLVKTRYIAICEGDDYWIDPYKLQKQVDFLENNKNCTAVFNRYYILENDKITPFNNKHLKKNKIFTLNEVLDDWFIQTATLVFLASALENKNQIRDICTFDRTLVYDLALNGNIGFIDDYMTVYRAHDNGITRSKNYAYAFIQINKFKLSLDKLNILTDYNYKAKIQKIYYSQLWELKMRTISSILLRLFYTFYWFRKINFFNKNKIKSNISLLFPKIYNIYKNL